MTQNKYVVLVGALLAQVTIAGLYAWSVFGVAIQSETGWSGDEILLTYCPLRTFSVPNLSDKAPEMRRLLAFDMARILIIVAAAASPKPATSKPIFLAAPKTNKPGITASQYIIQVL